MRTMPQSTAKRAGESIWRGIVWTTRTLLKWWKRLVRDVMSKKVLYKWLGKNVLYEWLGKRVIAPLAKGVFRDLPKATFKKWNQARKRVGRNFIPGVKKVKNGLVEFPNKMRLWWNAARETVKNQSRIASVFNPMNIISKNIQDARDLATMFVMEPLDIAKKNIKDARQIISHTGSEITDVLTQKWSIKHINKWYAAPKKSSSIPRMHSTPVKKLKPKQNLSKNTSWKSKPTRKIDPNRQKKKEKQAKKEAQIPLAKAS